MRMTQTDWYGYLDFLRTQIQGKDLKNPSSIAESFNNFNVKQDIDDVLKHKLKRTVREKKSPKAQT